MNRRSFVTSFAALGAAAALPYHAENRLVTGLARELVCRLALAGAATVMAALASTLAKMVWLVM